MTRKFRFAKRPVTKKRIARKLENLYRMITRDSFGSDIVTLKRTQPALYRAVMKLQRMYKRAENPCKRKPVLIYDNVEFIGATKGPSSHFAGKKFIHKFKRKPKGRGPKMYGLADGSILIK